MRKEWLDILEVKSEKEIDNISNTQWTDISQYQQLSEDFIEKFRNKVDWHNISEYQKLSEEFIEKFRNKVYWYNISIYQKLSEPFIERFQNKLDWENITEYQKLSEEFIEKFQDEFDWDYLSKYQKLSEEFIEKFQDTVYWYNISMYQKLSEEFIEKFQDKVDWYNISECQKLSEEFIEKFQDKVYWHNISKYQKLSTKFMEKYKVQKPANNWLYATKAQKMKAIKECGKYEINGDYIIAYKSTKIDGVSCYNPQYIYKIGKIYKSQCDCNLHKDNSFGLAAWTKKGALNYHSYGELYKVKIHIDDIGALIRDSNKIRCFKLEVIEKIDF